MVHARPALTVDDLLDMPAMELVDLISTWTPEDQDDALWWRCRHDVGLLGMLCFPTLFRTSWNALHTFLLERPDLAEQQELVGLEVTGPSGWKRPWHHRTRARRDAICAPRGHAKTTILTWLDVLHDVAYGLEVYVAIVSVDQTTADQMVKDLYDVFTQAETYEEFHSTFGPFRVVGTQTDFAVFGACSDNLYGTRIKSYTVRGSIRGHKWRGWRPSKVIFDDLEHPERALNDNTRAKTERWVESDAGEAGDAYTIFTFVGTLFHPDAVLNRKLHDSRWNPHRYKAMMAFPDDWLRRDEKGYDSHWERCREIYLDLDVGNADQRFAAAASYYVAHKEAMDQGAVTLWPEHPKQSLLSLMVLLWAKPSTFYTEKQNEPGQSDDLRFETHDFRYFHLDGDDIVRDGRNGPVRIPLAKCKIGVWLDPIPVNEKGKGRDDAALATVARCPSGFFYVLDVRLKRVKPDEQMDWLWGSWAGWVRRARYGYENNTGFKAEGKAWEAKAQGPPGFRPQGSQTRGIEKRRRIGEQAPDCKAGFIQFNKTLSPKVMEQYAQFPYGSNDDAPDAVERAIWLLKRSGELRSGHLGG